MRATGGVVSGTTNLGKIRHWGSDKATGDESFIVNKGVEMAFQEQAIKQQLKSPGNEEHAL
jgi:hypothetical protein